MPSVPKYLRVMVEVLPWSLAGSTLPCAVIQAESPLISSQIVTKRIRPAPPRTPSRKTAGQSLPKPAPLEEKGGPVGRPISFS
jgi:hypothetical protein